jgi:anti-anti-sigma factor
VLEDDPVTCSFVSTRGYADCAVLALRGDLDISGRAELSSQLAAVVSCGPWVIVDLADLAFIDCSSLGILAGARKQAQLAGGDVLLAGPRGAVARLLLLTDRAFSVFPSVGAAAFSAGLTAFGIRLAAADRTAGQRQPSSDVPVAPVVVVVGLILAVLGMVGHAVGGRKHYF